MSRPQPAGGWPPGGTKESVSGRKRYSTRPPGCPTALRTRREPPSIATSDRLAITARDGEGERFVEPAKVATKGVAGLFVDHPRFAHLLHPARSITAMRSDMDIASSWSWVA